MDVFTDAVIARLTANPFLTVKDGAPLPGEPIRKPPYVTVYVYVPRTERTKVNQTDTDRLWIDIETHSAGETRKGAGIVRAHVWAALDGWTPVVAGYKSSSVRLDEGNAPDLDETTGIALMDAIDHWIFRTQPA